MPASCQFAMGVHVLALLTQSPREFQTSSAIAESTLTNPVVVRRIVTSLQEKGLVETQKGPGGGVRLARQPEEINLAEVYAAVETAEPLHLPHTAPSQSCPIGQAMHRILASIFQRAEMALATELARTTLRDVIESALASETQPAAAHQPVP